MAGIYLHIPFCSKACHYCDFHFSTNQSRQEEMVVAMAEELKLRHTYLRHPIETIYFGGGTPSLLSVEQLTRILDTIYNLFEVVDNPETTLEANPDDLGLEKLRDLKAAGINRLSIGVQSFDDVSLQLMNRSHSSKQALDSFENARKAGFNNVSLDLIFAMPPMETTIDRFERDLARLIDLNPEHVSLYGLTIEPKTVFGNWTAKKRLEPVPEELNALQYELAVQSLTKADYLHYEVSNFGKKGLFSRHNTSYWKGKHYLGIGPSAHSYNGKSRAFAVRNNAQYIKAIAAGKLPLDEENLNSLEQLNEYLLTSVRTSWGIDLRFLMDRWQLDLHAIHQSFMDELVSNGRATLENDRFVLSSKGFAIADEVTLRFFSTE